MQTTTYHEYTQCKVAGIELLDQYLPIAKTIKIFLILEPRSITETNALN